MVLLGIGIDLCSKWYVFARLGKAEVYKLIPEVLHVTPAQNTGVAFSWLKDWPGLILCVSFVAVGVLTWIYAAHWRKARALTIVVLGLLLVGAAGNLVDRVFVGHVRDFIDFVPHIPLIGHWAVFNVADMCITVGVALYVLGEIVAARGGGHESAPSASRR